MLNVIVFIFVIGTVILQINPYASFLYVISAVALGGSMDDQGMLALIALSMSLFTTLVIKGRSSKNF